MISPAQIQWIFYTIKFEIRIEKKKRYVISQMDENMKILQEPDAYNPFISPLFMPVSRQVYACSFSSPLQLPAHSGATPGTLINSVFRGLILAHACRESRLFESTDANALRSMLIRQDFAVSCISSEFQCARPDVCACEDLHRRRCSWQPGRVLLPVVRISAPRLWDPQPVRIWELEVTLLGRKANQHQDLIEKLVHLMGEVGLLMDGKNIPFSIDGPIERLSGYIGGEWNRDFQTNTQSEQLPQPCVITTPEHAVSMLLEFSTPLLLKSQKRNKISKHDTKDLHPSYLLGNLAFDLCALDMEDRDNAPEIALRRALCESARTMIQTQAMNIQTLTTQLSTSSYGARLSRTNQQEIILDGFFGHMVLKCPPELLPWLRALGHWRVGQLTSKGFGDIHLWYR